MSSRKKCVIMEDLTAPRTHDFRVPWSHLQTAFLPSITFENRIAHWLLSNVLEKILSASEYEWSLQRRPEFVTMWTDIQDEIIAFTFAHFPTQVVHGTPFRVDYNIPNRNHRHSQFFRCPVYLFELYLKILAIPRVHLVKTIHEDATPKSLLLNLQILLLT